LSVVVKARPCVITTLVLPVRILPLPYVSVMHPTLNRIVSLVPLFSIWPLVIVPWIVKVLSVKMLWFGPPDPCSRIKERVCPLFEWLRKTLPVIVIYCTISTS
jgi:hypothetical protein